MGLTGEMPSVREVESAYWRAGGRLHACAFATAPDDAWLGEVAAGVRPASREAACEARERWGRVAMPLGGLGVLQDDVCRIAASQGSADVAMAPRALVIFFADNGVVREGVSQCGADVTRAVAWNMVHRRTSSCAMAREVDCAVLPVNVGMEHPIASNGMADHSVRRATEDIVYGPAMTRREALAALREGVLAAQACHAAGARLVAAGEMGIGNTTTSAAVASVLLGVDAAQVVGRGAGLSSEGLTHKVDVVRRAIACNCPDPHDPVDVLARVGGLDIAAMAGFYLGCAALGLPAVLDGVISCVAALAAARLSPDVRGYLLASHISSEPAAHLLLQELGLDAAIKAGLHVGEGTGALALMSLLDLAGAVFTSCASFAASGIEPYQELV